MEKREEFFNNQFFCNDRSEPFTNTATAQTYSRTWEYAGIFDKEPVTTEHSGAKGALYDEVHIVVVDEDGEWTGTRESALETFTGTSVAKVQNTKMVHRRIMLMFLIVGQNMFGGWIMTL